MALKDHLCPAPFDLSISPTPNPAVMPSSDFTSGVRRAVPCSLCEFLIVGPREAETLFANLGQHGIHSNADPRSLGEIRARQYHCIYEPLLVLTNVLALVQSALVNLFYQVLAASLASLRPFLDARQRILPNVTTMRIIMSSLAITLKFGRSSQLSIDQSLLTLSIRYINHAGCCSAAGHSFAGCTTFPLRIS